MPPALHDGERVDLHAWLRTINGIPADWPRRTVADRLRELLRDVESGRSV